MIPVETLRIAPSSGGSVSQEARAAMDQLRERVEAVGFDRGRVLSLTFFVSAPDAAALHDVRETVLAVVSEAFAPETPPPTSLVAQAPESGLLALEVVVPVAGDEVEVARAVCEGLPYTIATRGDVRQVHAGGLGSSEGVGNPEAQSAEAFRKMEAVLAREGLTFGNVVRQWNYIESMLEICPVDQRQRQRYQVFNDVRTRCYGTAEFPAGYPAATGIGQTTGGVVIEFVALADAPDVHVEPISNPEQIDAHHYSTDVLVGRRAPDMPDRSPPKFERAKRVAHGDDEVVYVSGTASIVGEQSVALDDVAEQTRTTLGHIDALLAGRAPTCLRAYVKRAEDIPTVRAVCEEIYGDVPATYVQADVCRDELLVEIEGVRRQ